MSFFDSLRLAIVFGLSVFLVVLRFDSDRIIRSDYFRYRSSWLGPFSYYVFAIVFSLIELRASVRLLDKRRGARTALLWIAAFHVPLIAVTAQLRDLGQLSHNAAWVQGGCLVLAVAIAYWIGVGRWLRAVTRQGPIPLRPSTDGR